MKRNNSIVKHILAQLAECGFEETSLDLPDYPGAFRKQLTHMVSSILSARTTKVIEYFNVAAFNQLRIFNAGIELSFTLIHNSMSNTIDLYAVTGKWLDVSVTNPLNRVLTTYQPRILSRTIVKQMAYNVKIDIAKREYALYVSLVKHMRSLIDMGYATNFQANSSGAPNLLLQLREKVLFAATKIADSPTTELIRIESICHFKGVADNIVMQFSFLCNVYAGILNSHSVTIITNGMARAIRSTFGQLPSADKILHQIMDFELSKDTTLIHRNSLQL